MSSSRKKIRKTPTVVINIDYPREQGELYWKGVLRNCEINWLVSMMGTLVLKKLRHLEDYFMCQYSVMNI